MTKEEIKQKLLETAKRLEVDIEECFSNDYLYLEDWNNLDWVTNEAFDISFMYVDRDGDSFVLSTIHSYKLDASITLSYDVEMSSIDDLVDYIEEYLETLKKLEAKLK
jgi:hypothetical protein